MEASTVGPTTHSIDGECCAWWSQLRLQLQVLMAFQLSGKLYEDLHMLALKQSINASDRSGRLAIPVRLNSDIAAGDARKNGNLR